MPKVMVMVASYTVRDHLQLQAHSQSLWKGGAKYFSEGGIMTVKTWCSPNISYNMFTIHKSCNNMTPEKYDMHLAGCVCSCHTVNYMHLI